MLSEEENSLYEILRGVIVFQPSELQKHAQNVAGISTALAGLVGCEEDEIKFIYLGSLLHDIGKQFIPSHILNKKHFLTSTEYEEVQNHPWTGYVYLNEFVSNSTLLNTVLYHHERWNGTGYPYKLRQDEIPLGARICAIADVWDALISDRCYRNSWNMSQALDLIWTGAGSLFDPDITILFLKLVEDGYLVKHSKENFIVNNDATLHTRKSSVSKQRSYKCA